MVLEFGSEVFKLAQQKFERILPLTADHSEIRDQIVVLFRKAVGAVGEVNDAVQHRHLQMQRPVVILQNRLQSRLGTSPDISVIAGEGEEHQCPHGEFALARLLFVFGNPTHGFEDTHALLDRLVVAVIFELLH